MTPELVESLPETAANGTCFICNTNCAGPYLHTHREIWEGDVAIGRPCYEELIRICGGETKHEVEEREVEFTREVKRLSKSLNKTRGKVKKLESVRA